ncbi:hypothetical protein DM01DRAFT_1308683, partial [Hesseltinella vesiculosa]
MTSTQFTKGQAICMFYGEVHSQENERRLRDKLNEMVNIDICWQISPELPVLARTTMINSMPLTFKRYLDAKPDEEHIEEKPSLKSDTQLLQFLNAVFLNDEPMLSCYDLIEVSPTMIYRIIMPYSEKLEDMSPRAFTQWCTRAKVNFLNAPFSRKRKQGGKQKRSRQLHVLKKEYRDDLVINITSYIPRYQTEIKMFKDDGYEIIGYARKSLGIELNREANLEAMVRNLKIRSLVDKCFVSFVSSASERLSARDTKKHNNIGSSTNGNTQDMIGYISSCEKKICLVAIDFAGLTTNPKDLEDFVKDHENLEIIIIDQLMESNRVITLRRHEIIENPSVLSVFDCRKKCLQRSK